ncbi:MAG: hypothetical protein AAGA85_24505, partial [Bacteroidota bacterium]
LRIHGVTDARFGMNPRRLKPTLGIIAEGRFDVKVPPLDAGVFTSHLYGCITIIPKGVEPLVLIPYLEPYNFMIRGQNANNPEACEFYIDDISIIELDPRP